MLPSEWTMHPRVMGLILQAFSPLQVDLFASALNARLPRYCARMQDTAAWMDAFSFRWTGIRAYTFPPFTLIPRVLHKIRGDGAQVLLIAPRWPRRSWFRDLMDLLAGYPFTLPLRPDLLSQPVSGTRRLQLSMLHLTAWPHRRG